MCLTFGVRQLIAKGIAISDATAFASRCEICCKPLGLAMGRAGGRKESLCLQRQSGRRAGLAQAPKRKRSGEAKRVGLQPLNLSDAKKCTSMKECSSCCAESAHAIQSSVNHGDTK